MLVMSKAVPTTRFPSPTAAAAARGEPLIAAPLAGTKAFLLTFGCQMNKYDSGMVAGLLHSCGATVVEDAARADLVIITGGLGPTVDDVTREAVALGHGEDPRLVLGQVVERREETGPRVNGRRTGHAVVFVVGHDADAVRRRPPLHRRTLRVGSEVLIVG